ncbi:MAG TPA: glycosyltransferase family 9 protein [Ohtaekwangia sp.]|nr:glycosyltransferase family 9 protein [Ohtaekwangia sp.]
MSVLKCKNVLCVRLDNMGDVLMSSPAIHALKSRLNCKITLLTSSLGKPITPYIPVIDEVIVFDVPWVKLPDEPSDDFIQMVNQLEQRQFDGAVIFTVFSQSALPAAMLLYLAKIPIRIGYCRENPYALLTHWIPDEEPYTIMKHQVRRDLDLVKTIGVHVKDEQLVLQPPKLQRQFTERILEKSGVNIHCPWLIFHPGVSEKKREYPFEKWVETARQVIDELKFQVVFTGGKGEQEVIEQMQQQIGADAFSIAGMTDIGEFISVVSQSPVVVSVNTSTVHIAAATHTPVVVLYALTNPQHAPWKAPGRVLIFDVPAELQSKNEVLRFVRQKHFNHTVPFPEPRHIIKNIKELLEQNETMTLIPEMIEIN